MLCPWGLTKTASKGTMVLPSHKDSPVLTFHPTSYSGQKVQADCPRSPSLPWHQMSQFYLYPPNRSPTQGFSGFQLPLTGGGCYQSASLGLVLEGTSFYKSAPLGGAAEESGSNWTLCSFCSLDTLALGLIITMLWHKQGCRTLLLLSLGRETWLSDGGKFPPKAKEQPRGNKHGPHGIQLPRVLMHTLLIHQPGTHCLGLDCSPVPVCPSTDTFSRAGLGHSCLLDEDPPPLPYL